MRLLAACVLSVAGTLSASAQTAAVPLTEAVPTITVAGTARQDVRPDLAVVTLGVTTDRPQAADAAGDNATAANAIVAAARAAGIADADIQTSQLRLDAIRDSRDQSRTRMFRATNQITLRIHGPDKVGSIVGQLVARGVNDIGDIDFQVADPEPVLDGLRAKATADARRRAETYAKAAGVTLGRVLQIKPDGGSEPVPMRPYSMKLAAPAAAPAPPVEAGAQSLEAQVQVTWELTEPATPSP